MRKFQFLVITIKQQPQVPFSIGSDHHSSDILFDSKHIKHCNSFHFISKPQNFLPSLYQLGKKCRRSKLEAPEKLKEEKSTQ